MNAAIIVLILLKSGSYAAATPNAPQATAARDQKTYEHLWGTLIGGGVPAAVDFKKSAVVFLLAGSRPTGGYEIVVHGGKIEKKTLVIDAKIKGPPPGSMVTQAFTSPFAVVKVNNRKFKDVRWKP